MSKKYIKPGELKKRIRIQYKVNNGVDSNGYPLSIWVDLGATQDIPEVYRWAKWQWLHGTEFWQAAAVQSEAVAEVSLRYVAEITPEMRVLYKDATYEIMPPVDNILEQNRYLVFKVKTISGG